MADPFLGELRIVSFGFAPQGWAMANGQFLPINQNQALFALFGTTYGGNGQTTFALPDLRGRVPIHKGSGFTQGQVAGEQTHTLTISELPTHIHLVNAAAPPDGSTNINNPSNAFFSNSAPAEVYNSGAGNQPFQSMAPGAISNIGGSQAHLNMQPFLALTFIVALIGIFPSQN